MTEATQTIFDAEAKQRFPYEVEQDGVLYDTAYNFAPLSDERYLEFMRDLNIKGNDDEVKENLQPAVKQLLADILESVENIEERDDWRDLLPFDEQSQALEDFLAVAIVPAEEKKGEKRTFGQSDTQTVFTECFWNGVKNVISQTHVLKTKTDEWQKKYTRIQEKRFKQEPTKGLRRKPKIEYIPQDEKIGELYDEMFVSQTGFANGKIPLRFKTKVIHYIFASKMDGKK